MKITALSHVRHAYERPNVKFFLALIILYSVQCSIDHSILYCTLYSTYFTVQFSTLSGLECFNAKMSDDSKSPKLIGGGESHIHSSFCIRRQISLSVYNGEKRKQNHRILHTVCFSCEFFWLRTRVGNLFIGLWLFCHERPERMAQVSL